jgi:hypothetical protein
MKLDELMTKYQTGVHADVKKIGDAEVLAWSSVTIGVPSGACTCAVVVRMVRGKVAGVLNGRRVTPQKAWRYVQMKLENQIPADFEQFMRRVVVSEAL